MVQFTFVMDRMHRIMNNLLIKNERGQQMVEDQLDKNGI